MHVSRNKSPMQYYERTSVRKSINADDWTSQLSKFWSKIVYESNWTNQSTRSIDQPHTDAFLTVIVCRVPACSLSTRDMSFDILSCRFWAPFCRITQRWPWWHTKVAMLKYTAKDASVGLHECFCGMCQNVNSLALSNIMPLVPWPGSFHARKEKTVKCGGAPKDTASWRVWIASSSRMVTAMKKIS